MGEEQIKSMAGASDELAKYLETDSMEVRGIIDEARKIRLAMGKAVTVKAITPPVPVELSPEAMESEIRKFVTAKKSYTSVDIMDFIRYLKDKGYHFQENIVLENVYTRLEERKGRELVALMADIRGFLERLPWPAENDVEAFIEQKKSNGIICESSEIRRMILVEMIRNY